MDAAEIVKLEVQRERSPVVTLSVPRLPRRVMDRGGHRGTLVIANRTYDSPNSVYGRGRKGHFRGNISIFCRVGGWPSTDFLGCTLQCGKSLLGSLLRRRQ